jgi:aspartate/methionine/tyrosine aminotransferase
MIRGRVHYRVLAARPSIRSLASSKIRELFNEGFGADLLPFWVGEPDEPTPEFIRRAGLDSINAGETFYTHNLGSRSCAALSLRICRSCTAACRRKASRSRAQA